MATGRATSVRDFTEAAFRHIGVELEWSGEGVEETGVDKANGRVLVAVDPRYFRPTEVDLLCGDPTRAKEKLGWEATTSVDELVRIMVEHDLEEERRNRALVDAGFGQQERRGHE